MMTMIMQKYDDAMSKGEHKNKHEDVAMTSNKDGESSTSTNNKNNNGAIVLPNLCA